MNFGVLTINYRRPQIFKLFCASIKRLREEVGIDFPVVCVSEPEDAPICNQYNIHHIIYPNIPVSEKWNQGMLYLKELGVDYATIMGSDDCMSTQCLRNIMFEMHSDVDLIGLKQLYVYDTDGKHRGTLRYVTSGNFFGVGKTINRRILDAVEWRPWKYINSMGEKGRNAGMDSICNRNIAEHVKTKVAVDGIVVDCKSQQSLNKFTMFMNNHHGTSCDKSIFYNILSREERVILDSIHYIGVPVKFSNLVKRGRRLI